MNSLTKVAAFLREYHLEEYARGAHIEGFDDLIDLVESSDAEVATLCKTLDMKPGHMKKFQRLLGQMRRFSPTPPGSAAPNSRSPRKAINNDFVAEEFSEGDGGVPMSNDDGKLSMSTPADKNCQSKPFGICVLIIFLRLRKKL